MSWWRHRVEAPNHEPMNKYDWQRLKNLSLFKVWVTDRELQRWWPLVAFLTFLLLLATVIRWLWT
jgi:hypothetical protein